jgi:hypothetical protein
MSEVDELRAGLRSALNMIADSRLARTPEFDRLNLLASGVIERGNPTWKTLPAEKVFGSPPASPVCPTCGKAQS